MCTLTYIPTENGFILTHNRDEARSRVKAGPMAIREIKGVNVCFPADAKAGGTWLAAAEDGRVLNLLNGAFVKHKHLPPYNRSRGLIAIEYFEYSSPEAFTDGINLEGVEPFTLVLSSSEYLFQFRWDGTEKHLLKMDPSKPAIWSSVTLYPPEIRDIRRTWFEVHLEEFDFHPELEQMKDFHHNAGKGDSWNSLVMNREGKVETVSISSIEMKSESIDLWHKNLVFDEEVSETLMHKTVLD